MCAADGLCYVPMPVQPTAHDLKLGVAARGGEVTFRTLDEHVLRSAWPDL